MPGKRCKQKESHVPLLLLIVVLAALSTMLWYRALLGKYNQGLHHSVIANLQELFPQAIVQIGSVSADGPDKIVVNNLRLASTEFHPQRPIMSIHRAVLHGDLDIANWVQKTTRVTQVDLHGVRVDVWPIATGMWSVQALQPNSSSDHPTPTLLFRDASVRLFSDATRDASIVSVQDLEGSISAVAEESQTQFGNGAQPRHRSPLAVHLACRSTGLLKKLELTGQLDLARQSWQSEGAFENLNFSPRLLESLPPELSQTLSQLSGFECLASSRFRVSRTAGQGVSFEVQGRITSGRLRDPRFPYPLDKLSADFFCKNQILQLRSMRASSGEASLELSSDIMGFGRDVPMVIHATATNLEIDSRLRESLPASMQEQWDRLQPTGRVSGDIQLAFDGKEWTPVASLRCEQVSITPWLFPYPLSEIQGKIRYQDGTLSSEHLSGLAGGQPVSGSLSLSRSGSQWYGRLSGQSEGPIAIDETLLTALSPEGKEETALERFVRSLHPRGAVQLTRAIFEKADPDDSTWRRKVDINVIGGSIKYDHFRYPIYEIQGRIAGQDDSWWLHQFEGRNDSGKITCTGNWRSASEGESPFDLRFEATAVPIEEELQRALTKDVQYVWDELQPSGSIDRVEVQLTKRPDEPLKTRVAIEERSESNQQAGRSLRLQPKHFPMWLTDIDCKIEYVPGRVIIHQAAGVNGDSRLSIQGECQPQADGRWLADVHWQPRTRLIVDSQLLRALPKSMRDSLVRIDFRGPVGVLGRSQVMFAGDSAARLQSAWNCQFDIENGQFGDGRVIGGLRGTVLANGTSDGTDLRAAGSVEMDALNVYGVPLTRLRGPYSIADNMLSFGTQVPAPLPQGAPAEMTADALTGQLTLAGVARLDDGKLIFNARLKGAELSGLLRDVGVERASTQAKCEAQLDFSGIPWNSQMWNGEGDIHLTDAKLFQLPFMMRLLGTASVNADDDSAFQTADIHFDIDGDKIPLQVRCEGEVLRLRGEGWTNLRRDIDLELYSYVGRRPIYSMVSPLLAESRYATFMMIEVEGTLDNPIMQRRPFPQIEATLQQIFPEVAARNRVDDLVPWR